MSENEVLNTGYGQMLDFISCYAIFRGAEPKTAPRTLSYEEAINLR